ncbi:MAG: conjugal transfer protein TraN [bacterium]
MFKKLLFLSLLSSLFLFTGKVYAVSPTTTYALSGTLTATNSSGVSFFTLSGSSETITGSNEASGSISYSSDFSGSIVINGSTTLTGSGDTINGITYDSSNNTFSGSIPLSISQTLTQSATCSDGSTPSGGSCSNGAYLTCPSGYSLSGSTCSETVSGSFTLSGSGSNINISGGNSSGSITMTQTQDCPTGYTLSSGTCVATAQAGTTSTFECTDNGSEYQNCASGSILPSGSAELCPYSQTPCAQNTATPSCPSGYTWNGTTCEEITTTNGTFSGGIGGFPFAARIAGSGNTIVGQYNLYGSITYSNGTFSGGIGGFPFAARIAGSGNTIVGQYNLYGSITLTLTTQTTSPTCPSGYTLSGSECLSYSCPLGSTPQGAAPGQNYTCVEPSGSSTYYCSPYICYNNSTNTPVSTTETLPSAQTNNGTVTSSGCSGSIYIFPGQALQCTRDYALGKNCCSRAKFLLGGRNCSSNSQIIAEAIIYDNQYSPPVPIYSGSGDMNTAPITSCSPSSIATGCGQQGEAIYLGDYCSLKIPVIGTCLANTYVFCKFQGLLATIIQAQGRAQLAGGPEAVSWGSVQSPNCTGFTPSQFQALNFSNMNLSEYIAVVKNQATSTLSQTAIQNQITTTTQSIGNEVQQLETGGALTGTTP